MSLERSKREASHLYPWIAVCSQKSLLDQLVQHEKGAFTGAESRKQGFGEEADGGTLFLDEIGNLPTEVQQHAAPCRI